MDADSCGICFDSLQNGQPVRELHSGADWSHIFHDEVDRPMDLDPYFLWAIKILIII